MAKEWGVKDNWAEEGVKKDGIEEDGVQEWDKACGLLPWDPANKPE